jgi:hypothetical protein
VGVGERKEILVGEREMGLRDHFYHNLVFLVKLRATKIVIYNYII